MARTPRACLLHQLRDAPGQKARVHYQPNNASQICACPNPWDLCFVTLLGKRDFADLFKVVDFKKKRLSRLIQSNPMSLKHKGLSLAEGGRDHQKGNQGIINLMKIWNMVLGCSGEDVYFPRILYQDEKSWDLY